MTHGRVRGGRVEALLLAEGPGAPMRRVAAVRTLGLRGLEGDRYALGRGHWPEDRSEPVTLVAAEALEEAARILGRPLEATAARRNIVTRGVDLNALPGRRFRVGAVTLEGRRPCHPCRYLEELMELPGLKRALKGRGGLRAVLRSEGTLRVGDPVTWGHDEVAVGAPTSGTPLELL